MDLDQFIKRVRASKQFDHLYHFTDKKNLPSIKERGLLCTSELRRIRLFDKVVTGGDANSLISDANAGTDRYVCLCFTTNHPMCFRAAERGLDPIYLSIDPEIVRTPGVLVTNAPSNQNGVVPVAVAQGLDSLHLDCIYQWIDWSLNPGIRDQRILAEKYEILVPRAVATSYISKGL
jgi:hypothetical protein